MAVVLDAFASQLLEKLVSLVKAEVVMLWGVEDEIRKLYKKLQMIENVLEDAERRIEEKNIDLWLRSLREIMYDIDDVIDEYLFEGIKHNTPFLEGLHPTPPSTIASLVCCYPPLTSCCYSLASRHKIGSKIKSINVKLDDVIKDKEQFDLKSDHMNGEKFKQLTFETSSLPKNEIVGSQIEDDTRKMVDLLVQKMEDKQCLTLGIVGMGGIGKTTLAQKIFSHEIITKEFPVRMWVYVSKDFSELNTLKSIIRQAEGSYLPETSKADLHRDLPRVIGNKRFLLVLDDTWEAKVWNELRAPFNSCATSGRVLVTTRDVRVMGSQTDTMHIHEVGRLPIDDGWSILYRKVLLNRVDETKVERFKEIGVKIVEKCGGHPLAIQAIGGVLLSISDESEMKWEEVLGKLGNKTWSLSPLKEIGSTEEEEVMNVLYLSYQQLPPPLKPCFLYFSLFTEGFELRVGYISGLWISEGLIKVEGSLSLEEVAHVYYKELIRRNLLQLDPESYADYGCTMHDLILSLAKLLVKEENYVGDFRSLGGDSVLGNVDGCRRLSMVDESATVVPRYMKQYKHARALFFQVAPSLRDVGEDLFTKLRRLRVLNLTGTCMTALPKSIGSLVHLRFLDISETEVREVPEVIGRLINLQFFFLKACKNLHSLPRELTNLYNLRNLNFTDSPVDHLPKGIGGLRNLRALFDFVVGSPHGGNGRASGSSSLEELNHLHELTRLSISKLERASSSAEARAATLEEKRHLLRLELKWTSLPERAEEEEIREIEGVFNELCPPPSLKNLTLKGFFGPRSPSWLDSCGTLLPNLTRLNLWGCVRCRRLPPLGRLPQLDYLEIKGAPAIVTVGPELMFDGDGGVAFPKLKMLFIYDMPNWEEWCGVEGGSLPRLELLQMRNCPKLRSLPDGLRHATSLRELFLLSLHSITEIGNLVGVKEVVIANCSRLDKVSNLPVMETLELYLDPTEGALPEWLQRDNLGALRKLKIFCSIQLLQQLLPRAGNGEDAHGTEGPEIQDFPHVYAEDIAVGSNYCFSYTKHPFSLNTNLPK